MNIRVILVIVLAFLAQDSFAQSRKEKRKAKKRVETVQQPTSRNPSYPTAEEYTPKASRKSSRKSSKSPTYQLEQEYYECMEEVAKERKKAEKIMQKPQYSDPMYFGHKRPPKKRKPSKMKFCKVCSIRH